MPTKKIIFVAFAIEDVRQRDLLRGQSLNTQSPFEYIDMSVTEAYESDWKDKVTARIRRSHGVIVLASKDSSRSSGQKWEIDCALAEGKRILAIRAYSTDYSAIPGLIVQPWDWKIIANFIDNL